MPTDEAKTSAAVFPLRPQRSVRQAAEAFSKKEGVSLNQFINVAVADRLARLEHEELLKRRKKPDRAKIARVIAMLERAGTQPPEPGDELPEGYVPRRASQKQGT